MARPKLTYTGCTVTQDYLRVHFSMEVGLTLRFCDVAVPIAEISTPSINDAVQRELNRQARELYGEDMPLDQTY